MLRSWPQDAFHGGAAGGGGRRDHGRGRPDPQGLHGPQLSPGPPLRVQKIRAGRSTPGLRPQHLSGLEMIRDLCDGQLEGAEIGSTEITFIPEKIKGGIHTADTKTAGSVCLLMQVSMPCILFAASPSELRLKGGTNAEMAPQIDYTVMVFKPIVEKFGFTFNCDIKMRGYYPKGVVK